MRLGGAALGGGGPPLGCIVMQEARTYYVRGQSGKVLAEYEDLDEDPSARYIYAGSQRIAMIDSDDNVYYYLNDHLGSAGVLITSTGTVRDTYKYKPFGGAFVAKMALPVRSSGYSLWWLEQVWDTAFGWWEERRGLRFLELLYSLHEAALWHTGQITRWNHLNPSSHCVLM